MKTAVHGQEVMTGDRYTVQCRVGVDRVRRYHVVEHAYGPVTRLMSRAKARRIADDLNDGDARRRHAAQIRAEIGTTRKVRG